jgi:transcription antitermination protein NusB
VRRKARELAFKVLFEHLVGGVSLEQAWENSAAPDLDPDETDDVLDEAAIAFAHRLVTGFAEKQEQVDGLLESTIQGWSFGQMAKTDLSVLRLAVHEMLFEPTAHEPLIEVSVKIAKRYGGEDSGRFVNGVLARLYRQIASGEVTTVPKDD